MFRSVTLSVNPAAGFLKPSAAQTVQHLTTVARAVTIPVMVQYASEQTGVAITAEALWSVATQASTEVIYKIENRPPGPTISRLLQLSAGRARIFMGNAGFQLMESFDRGCVGLMPGASMTDLYRRAWDSLRSGNRTEATRLHNVLLMSSIISGRTSNRSFISRKKSSCGVGR